MSVFDNIKSVTGTTYDNALHNKDIIGMTFLRAARERGVCLPTNGFTDEPKYYGAYVFEPTAGLNYNVVYVDLGCFTDDHEVVTPDGIRNITELEVGDAVYTLDEDTLEPTVDEVVETHEYENQYGEIHSSDGMNHDFAVTENHRFYTAEQPKKRNQTLESEDYDYSEFRDLAETRQVFPIASGCDGDTPSRFSLVNHVEDCYVAAYYDGDTPRHDHHYPDELSEAITTVHGTAENIGRPRKQSKHLIPVDVYRKHRNEVEKLADETYLKFSRQSREIPKEFPIEDWLRLVGWYITEGSTNEKCPRRFCLAQKDEAVREKITEVVTSLGLYPSESDNGFSVSCGVIEQWLRRNCGGDSFSKQIPDFVFDLDSALMEILLETLVAGDGSAPSVNSRHYWTASEQLKDDIVQLATLCGHTPSVKKRDVWRIQFGTDGSFVKGEHETEPHNGKVYCITAEENHAILTGRNGKFQWIGQSMYPNLMRGLNASPGTIVGTQADLEDSEYTEDDCVWGYIDTRDVKHVSSDENWSQYRDPDQYKMVYDDDAPDLKWAAEPRYERCYFLKPSIKEGLITDKVQDLIDMKYEYKGVDDDMYAAVKRITNCYTADTEVLTPQGVVNIRELEVGDEVYSIDPDTEEVSLKPVTETFAYPDYGGEIHSFTNQNVDLSVTPNHKMVAKNANPHNSDDSYELVAAEDLSDGTSYELPHDWDVEHGDGVDLVRLDEYLDGDYEVLAYPDCHGRTFQAAVDWKGDKITLNDSSSRGYCFDAETFAEYRDVIEANSKRLCIHCERGQSWVPLQYDGEDFLELLAWFITEGSTNVTSTEEYENTTRGITHTFNIAQERGEQHDQIAALLDRMGLTYYDGERDVTVASQAWRRVLEGLCGEDSFVKQIPELVFEQASLEQKELFYETMMAGDGDSKDTSYRYTTSSETLRDDVMRLCVHIGRTPKYTHDSGSWRVYTGRSKNTVRPARCRDVTSTENGVYCVEVADNHTLLGGRNGKFQFCGNSVYGYVGFSTRHGASNVFDWRIAEAVTLSGRKVIQYTADAVQEYMEREYGIDNTYVALGDSVPADEVVTVENPYGNVEVRRIEDLYSEVGDMDEWTGYRVWTEDGFTPIHRVIQKPNRKTMYRVRTKNGITHVTEDHSLLLADGTEISPEEVSEGDKLLHRDVGGTLPSVPSVGSYEVDEKLAWLYGLFVADGSCGVYESGGKKRPWAISKSDKGLLERAGDVVEDHFDVNSRICDYRDSSGCYKLKVHGFDDDERISFVESFRDICYDGEEKRVPPQVLNADEDVREAFLEGYHAGDGYERDASAYDAVDSMQFRDRILAQGIAMIVQDAGYDVTIDCRDNHGEEYYRIRTVSFHRGEPTVVESVETFEYNGEYVYDLETENHHFQAGVGNTIVHNTDGAGICWPDAPSRDRMLDVVGEAVEHVNTDGYAQFMNEEFGMAPDAHYMDVEIESFAPKVLVPGEDNGHSDVGVKKRYAQWLTVEDEEEVDDIDITGLEHERSDTADVTRDLQMRFFEQVLRGEKETAKEELFPYLREIHEAVRTGEYPLDEIAKRGGISQPLSEYGAVDRTPSPIYRGAKYAERELGLPIKVGSKPKVYYVEDFDADYEYSRTYTAETAEHGTFVDAIAVENVADLPDGVNIDYEKHCQKTVVDPLEPLLHTVGWDWDGVLYQHSQSAFDSFA